MELVGGDLRVGHVVPSRKGASEGTDTPASPGTPEPSMAINSKVPRPEDATERLDNG